MKSILSALVLSVSLNVLATAPAAAPKAAPAAAPTATAAAPATTAKDLCLKENAKLAGAALEACVKQKEMAVKK